MFQGKYKNYIGYVWNSTCLLSAMYYLVKIIQATGLTIILIDFVRKFPQLMNPRIFLLGIFLFTLGWGVNHLLIRK